MLEHGKVVTIRPAQRWRRRVVIICCLLVAATLLQLTEELSFIGLSQGRKKEAVSPRDSGFEFEEFPRDHYVVYSKARDDRSGAAIQDMLMAHAYAYSQNWTYAGACSEHRLRFMLNHNKLIDVLGLKDVLVIQQGNCPPLLSQSPFSEEVVLDESSYRKLDAEVWTKEWLETIRPEATPLSDPSRRVVVHMRRGDVSPCHEKNSFRYLTNQYFLDALSSYSPEEVTIYSETKSIEGWDDFAGYNLMLDTPIEEVWRGMIEAEILILSKSSFSFVPALWNQGTVIYFPFWHDPLPAWQIVDEEVVEQEKHNMDAVVSHYCSPESLEY